jgi:hypothetical protein
MKQKLVFTLAVAVMALSGAREASEQFHRLKSFAGELGGTGFLGALVVFASGESGTIPRPARALVASSASAGEGATRARRALTRARARRAGAEVLKVETAATRFEVVDLAEAGGLAAGFAPLPEALRLDARSLGPRAEAAAEHERIVWELEKLSRAEVFLKVARRSRGEGRERARVFFELPQPLRIGQEFEPAREKADRDHEADDERRKARDSQDESDENDARFFAPAAAGASGSLLNCDTEPRR